MKIRKLNIKNGELLEIYINGAAALVCLRSDKDSSLFVKHSSTPTHAIDWGERAETKIEMLTNSKEVERKT